MEFCCVIKKDLQRSFFDLLKFELFEIWTKLFICCSMMVSFLVFPE